MYEVDERGRCVECGSLIGGDVSDDELVRVIEWLMDRAKLVSNLKKPESDNNYGRAAMALRWCLSTEHPLWPR